MKIVEPKYEILTDISEGGIKELQQIERVARVCYKSEDKITPDGESAKKLVGFLVKQGHEAMLEHSQLSVLFTCDRGVANELVRHRIASFAQESTRYCNYSKEKFGGELTFIWPSYIRGEQYCELNDMMRCSAWSTMSSRKIFLSKIAFTKMMMFSSRHRRQISLIPSSKRLKNLTKSLQI